MPQFFTSLLFKLLGWSQRLIIGVTVKATSDAAAAVAETDAASASRKDAQGQPNPYSADEALAESIRRFCLRNSDAAYMPDVIVRRLIQAAHLFLRLKTLAGL